MARQLTAPPPAGRLAPPPAPGAESPAGRAVRIWSKPLWAHAVALAVVLLALVPVLGTGSSFSADEGAAIVQARHLSRGEGWLVDHPLPQADPTGKAYPLELSGRGPNGAAPFVKHPLYALLLAGADRVAGTTGMVLLSVAGTLIASALAASLAGQLRPDLSRPALWVTGLATPLLFDGYLVIAHTLGAAAAAGAVLLALRAAGSRGRRAVAVAEAAGCIAVAVLLRNEAVFWGLGLGVTLGTLAVLRRNRALAGAAIAVVGAAGLAHFGEALWYGRILGSHAVGLGSAPADGGLLAGRAHSLALTWLRPGYGKFPGAELALVVMLAAVIAGTVAARRHPDSRRVIAGLAVVAALASLTAFVVAPTNLVPGLLMAAPVIAAGLVALRRSSLRPLGAQVALGTFTVFALAVVATQYSNGGSAEWGGRYFALGLPVLVPVVVLALADLGARLEPFARRAGVAALVVCSLSTIAMGLTVVLQTHRFTARLTAAIDHVGQGMVVTGDKPVVLATNGAVPRFAWATFDRQRWLLADPADLAALTTRLRAAGVDRALLVTDQPVRDTAELGARAEVVSDASLSGGVLWHLVQLRLR